MPLVHPYTHFVTLSIVSSTGFVNSKVWQNWVEDAEELAKYGEKRVALENFLENVLANEVTISKEAVTLAEKAFSDAPNDYDIELINELKKTDVT